MRQAMARERENQIFKLSARLKGKCQDMLSGYSCILDPGTSRLYLLAESSMRQR